MAKEKCDRASLENIPIDYFNSFFLFLVSVHPYRLVNTAIIIVISHFYAQ